jgi:hypothetical protein
VTVPNAHTMCDGEIRVISVPVTLDFCHFLVSGTFTILSAGCLKYMLNVVTYSHPSVLWSTRSYPSSQLHPAPARFPSPSLPFTLPSLCV